MSALDKVGAGECSSAVAVAGCSTSKAAASPLARLQPARCCPKYAGPFSRPYTSACASAKVFLVNTLSCCCALGVCAAKRRAYSMSCLHCTSPEWFTSCWA